MEEDNLKNYISMYEELKRNQDIIDNIDKRFFFEFVDTLLKAYKEKESKYNKALSDLVQSEHENKELKIKIDDKETELQILKDDIKADEIMYKSELIESYIPTSLVKEKIEQLEVNILDNEYASDNDKDIAEYQVLVLQKLLEKRK